MFCCAGLQIAGDLACACDLLASPTTHFYNLKLGTVYWCLASVACTYTQSGSVLSCLLAQYLRLQEHRRVGRLMCLDSVSRRRGSAKTPHRSLTVPTTSCCCYESLLLAVFCLPCSQNSELCSTTRLYFAFRHKRNAHVSLGL